MNKKYVVAALTAAMALSSVAVLPVTAEEATGSVYYLNMKPEADEAWQNLAAAYTDETGVPVTVLTAAAGQYDTTLQSEMAKSEAPTIFNIGSTADCQTWADYLYDLKDTEIYSHLTDKALSLEYDEKVAAVASYYECYGLIYNKTILEGYCGMENAVISSVDEIKDFETLKAVCDDIQARIDEINDELGLFLTEAIASPGLDAGSSWRFSGHLANFPLYYEFLDDGCDLINGEAEIDGTYLDNFKAVWDLYMTDTDADPATLASGALNAEAEFGLCEAVFYQNGDWEFSALTNPDNGYEVTEDDIAMMPIYFGVDDATEGLACGTEGYYAVNAKASEEDIAASIDFLNWLVTSDTGREALVNDMGFTCPYDTFVDDFAPTNKLASCANELAAEGRTSIAWSFNATPNVDDWRADVVSALTAYADGSGEWSAVETAFVEGWADQWALAHEE